MSVVKEKLQVIVPILVWTMILIVIIGVFITVVKDYNEKIQNFETRIQNLEQELENERETNEILKDLLYLPMDTPSFDEMIQKIIDNRGYNVDPYLIQSIVYYESRGNEKAINYNGTCVGLMQISTKWHTKRAESLGVYDLFDPYGNLLVGIDYISELIEAYKDPALALMLYNMKHESAFQMYKKGEISSYAKLVLSKADELRKGG